jgi:hypothetical protein
VGRFSATIGGLLDGNIGLAEPLVEVSDVAGCYFDLATRAASCISDSRRGGTTLAVGGDELRIHAPSGIKPRRRLNAGHRGSRELSRDKLPSPADGAPRANLTHMYGPPASA